MQADGLVPLGGSGAGRGVIGETVSALPPSAAVLFDRQATLDVELVSADFELTSVAAEALATGANRALLGPEVIQFADAVWLEGSLWRLRGLLRGRGGTEEAAQAGHAAGTPFVLLDGQAVAVDPAKLDPTDAISLAAIGLADDEPVIAPIANPGLTLRPLTPVHPRVQPSAGGGLILRWTRRARGAWTWPDGIETPLSEQAEAYTVGLGDTAQPALRWELAQPRLELSAATLAQLSSEHPGQPLWVRQVGSFAQSDPLSLTTL